MILNTLPRRKASVSAGLMARRTLGLKPKSREHSAGQMEGRP
jgi:hypothetical protein